MHDGAPPPASDAGFSIPIAPLSRRRRALMARLQMAAILLILLGVVSIPATVVINTWLTHRSLIREWQAKGPACPVLPTLPIALMGGKPPKPFSYRGARFAHQIGDVECAAVPVENPFSQAHYTVCQFDAPAAIAVEAYGRHVLFAPGIGRGAMVTVRDGQVRCALSHPLTVGRLGN